MCAMICSRRLKNNHSSVVLRPRPESHNDCQGTLHLVVTKCTAVLGNGDGGCGEVYLRGNLRVFTRMKRIGLIKPRMIPNGLIHPTR